MVIFTDYNMREAPQILIDTPNTQLMNWGGYSAKKDKTMLASNFLVEPSQNCFIPDGDKVIPREGSQVVFQGSTPFLPNVPIIGGYTKFKNFFGVEMDIKAYRDTVGGEQIYALYNGVYVPITINPNTQFNGNDKIYFSTYTDSTLELINEKRIPRLCWVNGYKHTDETGRVFSWTGGISVIDTVVANVITLPTGQTWKQLGFTEYFLNGALTGEIHITINGVDYFSTNLAELDTNTLTLNSNPIAVAGDIVTSTVEVDELVAPMDMLKQNKNYMYYGNWMYRQWWMSNQFGRPSVTNITQSNAQRDDLVIDPNTNYTGQGRHIYKLVIDSVDPAVPAINNITQEFHGKGTPIFFDVSGYNVTTGKNKYVLKCVYTQIFSCGSYVGTIIEGEPIVGGTSGATGVLNDNPQTALNDTSVHTITGAFVVGETVTGQTSGATFVINVIREGTSVLFFKNDTQIPLSGFFSGNGIISVNGVPTATPLTLVDGLVFDQASQYQFISLEYGDYVELNIETAPAYPGSPDTFTWQKDNKGTVNGPFPLPTAGSPITIEDGIEVYWISDTGHEIGDYWIIEVNQEVIRPWANFYYTIDFVSSLPIRRPGEGYIYSLPSNFWTMDTLEESMYVNTSNGEWGYSSPTLSSNLLSEDISFIPLKQSTASKVLYPYLTGHNRNDLLFIDENKNLTSLGRLQLIERVQMKDISDFVRNAFNKLSFINGSIIFQDEKIWITSPEEDTMLVFDERTQYWQPPQFIPNLGILTIVGTKLYTHSNLNTATRSLNDETAIGDDGVEYEVIIRTSTFDYGNRWIKKTTNTAFWEGYVEEAPPMKLRVYFDPNGCRSVREDDIIPIFCCDVTNPGEFGGGQDGGHPFGIGLTNRSSYCRFEFDKMGVEHFYFASLEFYCRTKKHSYEILSMGINLSKSKFNNKDYKSKDLLPI